MTDNNGHVDGDDYTWDGDSQPGAVLKPAAAFAALRAQFGAEFDRAFPAGLAGLAARDQAQAEPGTAGRYSLLDEMTELEPAWPVLTYRPDLRTADQVERDDVAALRADLERLAELVRLTTGPVDVALQVDMQRDKLGDFDRRLAQLEQTVAGLVKVLEVRIP